MRDPQGKIYKDNRTIIRELNNKLDNHHFLFKKEAIQLVNDKKIIGFIVKSKTIVSDEIPFVTYPSEWCDAQLHDAALLTLHISKTILRVGYELKDASAWNIIFHHCKPMFCDHLSFQEIKYQKWFAFGQFIRHFVFPLMISRYKSIKSSDMFLLSIDGVQPETAKKIMGLRRFITPFWVFMLNKKNSRIEVQSKFESHGVYHEALYSFIENIFRFIPVDRVRESVWVNYRYKRDHYTDNELVDKYTILEKWINYIRPKWVADFGCNTGEYSKLAARSGAEVVAIDMDHECIQRLYLTSKDLPIYPVLINFSDIAGGRGWMGVEIPSLIARLDGKFDVVMMLAIVHHLAIGNSIPLDEVAYLAARCTQKYLIVELIDSNDPLVVLLCRERMRLPEEFSLPNQIAAFRKYFEILDTTSLSGGSRKLYLMSRSNINS